MMNARILFLLLVFTLLLLLLALGTVDACIDKERQALLRFKKGLVDDRGFLSSWGAQEDCCRQWRGVRCDNVTGHVIELDLTNCNGYFHRLQGKIDPSLRELQNLQYLDLSCNDFEGRPIPSFIGYLSKLDYLGISSANFGGNIPTQLGNLSNLHSLDLGFNDFEGRPISKFIGSLSKLKHLDLSSANFIGSIPAQLGNLSNLYTLRLGGNDLVVNQGNLEFLSGLSALTVLDLNRVNLSRAIDWVQSINGNTRLTSLVLIGCELSDVMPPSGSLRNSSLSQLTHLDLSNNHLTSSIHWFSNSSSSSLVDLNLGQNHLEGVLPDSLRNLCQLRYLNLENNTFSGDLSDFIHSFSGCTRHNLQELYLQDNRLIGSLPDMTSFPALNLLRLGNNHLTGILPQNFTQHSSLSDLSLENNQIGGPLLNLSGFSSLSYLTLDRNYLKGTKFDFTGCSSLRELSVSNSQLTGNFPMTIGQLSSLERLDLSSNSLEGVVSEHHFSNLTSLSYLTLSFNKLLTFQLGSDWIPPFDLVTIFIASCRLGPTFPKWLRTLRSIHWVDISSNGISEALPTWIWNISTNLRSMDLSSNRIPGIIPNQSHNFDAYPGIDLSSNLLVGSVPHFFSKSALLNLSKNKLSGPISFLCATAEGFLMHLDLSHNLFSGRMPNCWNNFPFLIVLNMAHNNLSGTVESSIGSLSRLDVLDLYNNSLTGELPSSLKKCKMLTFMDIGFNKFNGNIPTWIGENLLRLNVLSLQSNTFDGVIPSHICYLRRIQVLNLSQNKLFGAMPRCINNFTIMSSDGSDITGHFYSSANKLDEYDDNIAIRLKGQLREHGEGLQFLKCIDLSSNKLTGEIPKEITFLVNLNGLDLSRNKLHGVIPSEIGQMNRLESLDLSRNNIFGEIPTSISNINFLSYLDLSYNNLSGRIPSGTQIQGFNASAYAGNVGLCGPPLTVKCTGDDNPAEGRQITHGAGDNEAQQDKIKLERWSFIGMAYGFAFGFWGICGTLLLSHRLRHAYFHFLESLKERIDVSIAFNMSKLKNKFKSKKTSSTIQN